MFTRNLMVRAVATAMAASFALAGCGGSPAPTQPTPAAPAAKEEPKELYLYTSFNADLYNPLAQAFEQKTGIKVEIVSAGTGEMLNRIKGEQANPQGDVMLGGGSESFEAYREVFEPYKVTEDGAIPSQFKAKDNLWYAYNSLPMVIAYNKNLVKEADKPRGWQDLTDPKWKGKLAMADADKSGTSYVQIATIVTIFGRDDQKGWDTLKAIVGNAKVLGSSSLPVKGTNDGEYAVALTQENAVWKYAKAGGPIGMVYPAEGTAAIADSAAVIKGAKHPQNARKFMDFLTSKEGQEFAAKYGLRPVRNDVPVPEGLPKNTDIKLVELDPEWVTGKRSEILATWKSILTSK